MATARKLELKWRKLLNRSGLTHTVVTLNAEQLKPTLAFLLLEALAQGEGRWHRKSLIV